MVQEIVSGLTTKSLVAFGLPSVIVQVIVPKLVNFFQQYPRGAKFLTYIVAFLSVFGTFTFGVRPLLEKFVWDWLPRVQLQSDDLLYRYLRKHVDSKAYPAVPHVLHGSVDDTVTPEPYDSDEEEDLDEACHLEEKSNCSQESDITYRNPSTRIFFHEGTLFVLETPWRVDGSCALAIRAFAFSHRPIKLLLKDAWSIHGSKAREMTTAVYRSDYSSWKFMKHKVIRHLSTVDIDDTQKRKLIKDIARYVSPDTKAWYRKRGVPCRRGYLFHGPPGTGKSSLAAAVAGHFQASLFTLSMNESGLNDHSLLDLLNKLPRGSVLLIEDIDSSGIGRESYDSYTRSRSNVTLSGLLNALDGASAPEGHIVIMSTNTPDALDPALRRAGRVDCEIEFQNASKSCAMKIFLRMMKDDGDDDDAAKIEHLQRKASEFAAEIPEHALSPAEIQGYLLDHRFEMQSAITNASSWATEVMIKKAKAKEAADEARRLR